MSTIQMGDSAMRSSSSEKPGICLQGTKSGRRDGRIKTDEGLFLVPFLLQFLDRSVAAMGVLAGALGMLVTISRSNFDRWEGTPS